MTRQQSSDKALAEIIQTYERGMDKGGHLVAKHALQLCKIIQDDLIVLMKLLEDQLAPEPTEKNKEPDQP